jgi:NAD(P) transhydrogenase subunit alpha
MDFISILSIFVLACFVGYYVVWSVTPALHTPLMSVTNAISSVIVVGALIASAAAGVDTPGPMVYPPTPKSNPCLSKTGQLQSYAQEQSLDCLDYESPPSPAAMPPDETSHGVSHWLGLVAVALASVNIFGGFAVTQRMLSMYRKRERPVEKTHG